MSGAPYEVSVTQLTFENDELSVVDNKTAKNEKREIKFRMEKRWWPNKEVHQTEGGDNTNSRSEDAY